MFLRPPEAKRRGGDGGGGIGKAREMRVEFAMRQRGPRFAFFHSLSLSFAGRPLLMQMRQPSNGAGAQVS